MIAVGKPIVLVGGGGHARVVANVLKLSGEFELVGYTDPRQESALSQDGVRHLGGDEVLPALRERGVTLAAIGVGGTDNSGRRRLFDKLVALGFVLPVICHPAAVIASDVLLGRGTVIMAGAVVNPGVALGDNVVINTGAIVEHDCRLGHSAQVGPGAILCGGVVVGAEAFIGAGACVIQGINVGAGAFVGAGAVVTKDVSPGVTVVGNPARPRVHISGR